MADEKATVLRQLKKAVLRCAASFGTDIVELAQAVDAQKADRAAPVAVAIPVSAWVENTDAEPLAAGFAFRADAAVEGLGAEDGADTALDFASLETAKACGMANTAAISAGSIRYYAVEIPAGDLGARVRIFQGPGEEETT